MTRADTGEAQQLAARIWGSLRELVLDPAGGKAAVAAELGLSFSRARALPRLLAGPLTLRQLADALSTDPPHATLIVDGLCERGLVLRQPHPQDRRSKLVSLTEAGHSAAQRVAQLMGTPPAPLQTLDIEDLRCLDAIVGRLATGGSQPVPTDGGRCIDAIPQAAH